MNRYEGRYNEKRKKNRIRERRERMNERKKKEIQDKRKETIKTRVKREYRKGEKYGESKRKEGRR